MSDQERADERREVMEGPRRTVDADEIWRRLLWLSERGDLEINARPLVFVLTWKPYHKEGTVVVVRNRFLDDALFDLSHNAPSAPCVGE